jgi:nucleoid-associated protein YgaU
LAYLQQLLKALPHQAAAARQAHAQQKANRAQTGFKNKVLELLRDSEKQGYLNDTDVRELITEGEQALNGLIGVLDANPSPQNAIGVLDAVSGLMQLGWGSDGAADKAFQSLAKAAQQVYEQADRAFRRTPSSSNFQKLLRARQQLQFAGGTPKDRPDGWRPAGKSHTTQPGDTLSGLSQRYYGSPSYWDVIYLENLGIMDVDRLPPRVPLRIP